MNVIKQTAIAVHNEGEINLPNSPHEFSLEQNSLSGNCQVT